MIWRYVSGALALAFMAVLLLWSEERTDHAKTERDYAELREKAEQDARKAEKRERELEGQWQAKTDKEAQDAQAKINTLSRQLATASAARDRLLTAAASASRGGASKAAITSDAGQSVTSPDPLDLLVGVLARHSAELVEVGHYADGLRIAGEACERLSDQITR